MKTIIGIDPGKSGGWVAKSGGKIFTGKLNPLSDFLQIMKKLDPKTTIVYMEKLSGFIKGSKTPGAHIFRMGEYYFYPMGVFATLGIRLELVTPQKWQKAMGCGKRDGRSTTDWKNHLKGIGKRLYPDEKVFGWNADAFLILDYGIKTLR